MANGAIQFIVHDSSGYILRTGVCPIKDLLIQANEDDGETVLAGIADDRIHKVSGGRLVRMTPAEIDERKPTILPEAKRARQISREEYQTLTDRLDALEARR
jgi:hypothetical protein